MTFATGPRSGAAIAKELNQIVDELEKDIPTMDWLDIHTTLTAIATAEKNLDRTRDKLLSQKSLQPKKQAKQKGESPYPWLIIDSKGWTWGDCEHRIYLSSKRNIAENDFSNHYVTIDYAS